MSIRTSIIIDVVHAKAPAQRIPIYYPTLPKSRAQRSLRAVILAAMAFSTLFGLSSVHAQTALITSEPPVVVAQQTQQGGGSERRGPPPREAVAACANQAINSICSFEGRGGDAAQGTCRAPNADAPAACAPTDIPQNG